MQTAQLVQPIHIPDEWHDHDLLTFEQFCNLIHTPPSTVRDWRRRGIGPRWTKPKGRGRLDMSVAEAQRFLVPATTNGRRRGRPQSEGRKP